MERITEIGQTLRDWQEDNSVGWDKVQELNLPNIQRQMAIDKADFQKSAPVAEVKTEKKAKSIEKSKPKRSRGLGR